MPDPSLPDAQAEVAAAVEAVARDESAIEVPGELIVEIEGSAARPPEPPKALWLQIREMTVVQRVKLALRGNRDARLILLHDHSKLIRRMVLQNPRISEDEIVMLARDRNSDEDMLRLIAESREWTKAYPVRTALVENAKTPVAKALQLLSTLAEREISRLAKSKNVPNVIATQARRL
ncbi:MAG: hypothetical protein ACREQ9_08860, partial [Candidatus Binatia bacterium]